MTWDRITEILKTGWIASVAASVVLCAVALVGKRLLFRRVKRLAARTATRTDDILVDALNAPLNFAIFACGALLLERLMPNANAWDRIASQGATAVFILCGIIFAERFTREMLLAHDKRLGAVRLSDGVILGLVRALIFIVGGLILLDSLGVTITPLLASLGVGSLAVALALQNTLASFFAGLFLTLDKTVNTGDFIELETGEQGSIINIGWRSSTLLTPMNNHVVIPNKKLAESVVRNYNAPEPQLGFTLTCAVHYDSDLEQVERTALEVATAVQSELDEADKSFPPTLRFTAFLDSGIKFNLVMRCKEFIAQPVVAHALIKRLHKRFAEKGIVIPYPIQTLDLKPQHEQILQNLLRKDNE